MNLEYILKLSGQLVDAVGVVVLASTALLHTLRAVAAILKKFAEATPTKDDDALIENADKGLLWCVTKCVSASNKLKQFAIYSAKFADKQEEKLSK